MGKEDDLYKNILDNIQDGVYLVDRERRITYWNRGAQRITGYSAETVVGTSCADGLLMHVGADGQLLCEKGCPLAKTMADGQVREAEVYLHHASGHRVPVLIRAAPIRDAAGEMLGAVETFSDNSSLLAALRRVTELKKEAVQDPLTGVGNRRHIEMKLHAVVAESHQYQAESGVLVIDIDHFKNVNDSHGHDVGDRVLKMVANTLLHNIRSSDAVGRWGGDEFVAVIHQVDSKGLLAIADKLCALVARSQLPPPHHELPVAVSIGATMTRPEDTMETLVKRADQLLYQSKSSGRNRVSFSA